MTPEFHSQAPAQLKSSPFMVTISLLGNPKRGVAMLKISRLSCVYIQLFFPSRCIVRNLCPDISKRKGDLKKQAGKHAQLWVFLLNVLMFVPPTLHLDLHDSPCCIVNFPPTCGARGFNNLTSQTNKPKPNKTKQNTYLKNQLTFSFLFFHCFNCMVGYGWNS